MSDRQRRLVPRLVLLGALAATLAACGGDHEPAASAATVPGDGAWERLVPGGDCQCADGSEFNFWVRKANPKKVVFYLQDGGACFSAETCDPTARRMTSTRPASPEGPAGEGGIFAFADERNPFADYSVVYVPTARAMCTSAPPPGSTPPASPCTTRAMSTAPPRSTISPPPSPARPTRRDRRERRLDGGAAVRGTRLGSVAQGQITVLADGSGSYPDVPAINPSSPPGATATSCQTGPGTPADGGTCERPGAVHPERTARPRDRVRPPRLCL